MHNMSNKYLGNYVCGYIASNSKANQAIIFKAEVIIFINLRIILFSTSHDFAIMHAHRFCLYYSQNYGKFNFHGVTNC